MTGGAEGTETGRSGTSGGKGGTSGASPAVLRTALLFALFAYALIQTVSNVYSIVADHGRAGIPVDPFRIWLAEGTSLLAWAIMLLPIWWAVREFRPPRLSWLQTALAHAAMTVLVSLGHVGLMVAFREIGFWLAGQSYRFSDDILAGLLYEYRKDLATYLQLALIVFLIQWLVARYAARQAPVEPAILKVPDGTVTHSVPAGEIDSVRAAGNYVEIGWRGRKLLHRATLAAVESELEGQGFARIHRSRLVRKAAIRKVETNQSGDFDVELDSGETLRGSRRYRDNLG